MSELRTIKAVEGPRTAGNGNTYRRIQFTNNQWASYWHATPESLPVGSSWMVELKSQTRDGKTFWQVESFAPAGAQPSANHQEAIADKGRDERIQRECALKAAVEYHKLLVADGGPTVPTVLETAESFLAWLRSAVIEDDVPF